MRVKKFSRNDDNGKFISVVRWCKGSISFFFWKWEFSVHY